MREEVCRLAGGPGLSVFVVSNGSRPICATGRPNVHPIAVAATPDAADDWIDHPAEARRAVVATRDHITCDCLPEVFWSSGKR